MEIYIRIVTYSKFELIILENFECEGENIKFTLLICDEILTYSLPLVEMCC